MAGFFIQILQKARYKNVTKGNIYKPTTAEKKLLEVLINPENAGKTVTDICNLANVSRRKYYEAMGKEEFIGLLLLFLLSKRLFVISCICLSLNCADSKTITELFF